VVIRCNAGSRTTNWVGDFPGFPEPVWYDPGGIANIISFDKAEKFYKIRYDSESGNGFMVTHRQNGSVRCFHKSKKGLFYIDMKQRVSLALVTTAKDNDVDDDAQHNTNITGVERGESESDSNYSQSDGEDDDDDDDNDSNGSMPGLQDRAREDSSSDDDSDGGGGPPDEDHEPPTEVPPTSQSRRQQRAGRRAGRRDQQEEQQSNTGRERGHERGTGRPPADERKVHDTTSVPVREPGKRKISKNKTLTEDQRKNALPCLMIKNKTLTEDQRKNALPVPY